ncbi:hypothetical protein G6F65_018961 [Rhizopus arrhizus]|nr:hypothetical protein G6F65_018961 [Rhizopus arrhizus]
MRAPEQLERPAHVDVEHVHPGRAVPDAAIGIAHGVADVALHRPAVAQLLFQSREAGFFHDRPRTPGRRKIGRARQVGRCAVGAPVRHHAPGHAGGVRRLVLVAHFEQRAVAQVGLHDAVEHVLLLFHAADE